MHALEQASAPPKHGSYRSATAIDDHGEDHGSRARMEAAEVDTDGTMWCASRCSLTSIYKLSTVNRSFSSFDSVVGTASAFGG